MSVTLYDDAVHKKISSWIKDKNMRVYSPEETSELFENLSDMHNDKPISLPFISISRDDNVNLSITGKNPKSFDGFAIARNEQGAVKLNAIPMVLTYNIDIYAKKSNVVLEYLRNFVFNFINYPAVDIVVPYNDINYTIRSSIEIDPTLRDNSKIPQRQFRGQFKRWTITFSIPDAYFLSAPVKDNIHICSSIDDVITD